MILGVRSGVLKPDGRDLRELRKATEEMMDRLNCDVFRESLTDNEKVFITNGNRMKQCPPKQSSKKAEGYLNWRDGSLW